MILTHSQVSLVLSSGVVILFTGALFMSGYVLQQRTLNKLRVAVIQQMQPRPSPKIYLPERFRDKKQTTLTGESGAVMDVGSGHERQDITAKNENDNNQEPDAVFIEVRPSIPDAEREGETKGDVAAGSGSAAAAEAEKPLSKAERRRKIKEEIRQLAQSGEPVYYQRRLW